MLSLLEREQAQNWMHSCGLYMINVWDCINAIYKWRRDFFKCSWMYAIYVCAWDRKYPIYVHSSKFECAIFVRAITFLLFGCAREIVSGLHVSILLCRWVWIMFTKSEIKFTRCFKRSCNDNPTHEDMGL